MRFECREIQFVAGMTLSAFLMLASWPGSGEPTVRLDQTIQHLIAYVTGSGLTFVRNAERYNSIEAAEHMEKNIGTSGVISKHLKILSSFAQQRAC